jgi:hypothetical protein
LNHGTEVELFSTGDNELSESNSITSVGGFVCFTLFIEPLSVLYDDDEL